MLPQIGGGMFTGKIGQGDALLPGLDLGGIAKGYAVDRAIDVLFKAGATQAMVNAGGDLRVAGPREEIVHLRGACAASATGAVAIANAALASSAGSATRKRRLGRWVGAHLHGRTKVPVGMFSSASVIADRCMIADALTKVMFAAEPALAQRVIAACGAQVATHSARHGWCAMGLAA
ncbi:MAG: FAD:protein FMN transferase [Rudaea sp.]